jgi:hypothetical protein
VKLCFTYSGFVKQEFRSQLASKAELWNQMKDLKNHVFREETSSTKRKRPNNQPVQIQPG